MAADRAEVMKLADPMSSSTAMYAANRIAWPAGGIPSAEQARRATLQLIGQSRYDAVNRQWDAAERHEQRLGTIVERYVRAHPSAFFQASPTA